MGKSIKVKNQDVEDAIIDLKKAYTFLSNAASNVANAIGCLDSDISVPDFSSAHTNIETAMTENETLRNECKGYIELLPLSESEIRSKVAEVTKSLDEINEKNHLNLTAQDVISLGKGPINPDYITEEDELKLLDIASQKQIEEFKKNLYDAGFKEEDVERLIEHATSPEEFQNEYQKIMQEIVCEACDNENYERYDSVMLSFLLGQYHFNRDESNKRKKEIETRIKELESEDNSKDSVKNETYQKILENSEYDAKNEVYLYTDENGKKITFTKKNIDDMLAENDFNNQKKSDEKEKELEALKTELAIINANLANTDKRDFEYKSIEEIDARINEIDTVLKNKGKLNDTNKYMKDVFTVSSIRPKTDMSNWTCQRIDEDKYILIDGDGNKITLDGEKDEKAEYTSLDLMMAQITILPKEYFIGENAKDMPDSETKDLEAEKQELETIKQDIESNLDNLHEYGKYFQLSAEELDKRSVYDRDENIANLIIGYNDSSLNNNGKTTSKIYAGNLFCAMINGGILASNTNFTLGNNTNILLNTEGLKDDTKNKIAENQKSKDISEADLAFALDYPGLTNLTGLTIGSNSKFKLTYEHFEKWAEELNRPENEQFRKIYTLICNDPNGGYDKAYEFLMSNSQNIDAAWTQHKTSKDFQDARSSPWALGFYGLLSLIAKPFEAANNYSKIKTSLSAGLPVYESDKYSSSDTIFNSILDNANSIGPGWGYAYKIFYGVDSVLLSIMETKALGGSSLATFGTSLFNFGSSTYVSAFKDATARHVDPTKADKYASFRAISHTIARYLSFSHLSGMETSFNSALGNGSLINSIESTLSSHGLVPGTAAFNAASKALLIGYCGVNQGVFGASTAASNQLLGELADILICGDMSRYNLDFAAYKLEHKCSDFEAYAYATKNVYERAGNISVDAFFTSAIIGMINTPTLDNIRPKKINFDEAFKKDEPPKVDDSIGIKTPVDVKIDNQSSSAYTVTGSKGPSDGGPSTKPDDNPNGGSGNNVTYDEKGVATIEVKPRTQEEQSRIDFINELQTHTAKEQVTILDIMLKESDLSQADRAFLTSLREQSYNNYLNGSRTASGLYSDSVGVIGAQSENSATVNGHFETIVEFAEQVGGAPVAISHSVWVPDGTTANSSIQQTIPTNENNIINNGEQDTITMAAVQTGDSNNQVTVTNTNESITPTYNNPVDLGTSPSTVTINGSDTSVLPFDPKFNIPLTLPTAATAIGVESNPSTITINGTNTTGLPVNPKLTNPVTLPSIKDLPAGLKTNIPTLTVNGTNTEIPLSNPKIDIPVSSTNPKIENTTSKTNNNYSTTIDKLNNIFNLIKEYQNKIQEINENKEKQADLTLNSEYTKEYNRIISALTKETGMLSPLLAGIDESSYDDVLEYIQSKANDTLTSLTYTDAELEEIYNEASEEEKSQVGSLDEFKKAMTIEYQKELEKTQTTLNGLIEEFKALNTKKIDLDKQEEELNIERRELLAELQIIIDKTSNYTQALLDNGFQTKDGFIIINDNNKLVTKVPTIDPNNFSIEDLIMVHATRYFPENGVIKSLHDSTGAYRNTVHFALNGKVSSHAGGNWDDCPIIILDPLKEHIDQTVCLYGVDTYTYGSVKLSNQALILINSDNFDELYKANKDYIDQNKDRIILFSGDSSVAVNQIISILGYAPQKIGEWSWENKANDTLLNQYVQANYPDKLNTAHTCTPHKKVEDREARKYVLRSLGIEDTGEDMIIGLDVLYALRKGNVGDTKEFIINTGIFVKDDEIHLLGTKDYLDLRQSENVSDFQIHKVETLLKKYEMMEEKGVTINTDNTNPKTLTPEQQAIVEEETVSTVTPTTDEKPNTIKDFLDFLKTYIDKDKPPISEPIHLSPPAFEMKNNQKWINYDKEKLDESFKSTEIDGVTYYTASGEDFKFLVHVIPSNTEAKNNMSSVDDQKKIGELQKLLKDHPELFVLNDYGLKNTTISCSTISDKHMATFTAALSGNGNIILGFNEDDINKIYKYISSDGGINRDFAPISYDETVFKLGNDKARRFNNYDYDEVLIQRNGRKPDYIVSPFAPGDSRNKDNIKWAKAYGIPIVYIDSKPYIEKYTLELKELAKQIENGECFNREDYLRARELGAAITVFKVPYDELYNADALQRKAFLMNPSEENIAKIGIIGLHDYFVEAAVKNDPNSPALDAVINHFELNKKYPNLTRDELAKALIATISEGYPANDPSIDFHIELKRLDKYAKKVETEPEKKEENNASPEDNVIQKHILKGKDGEFTISYSINTLRECTSNGILNLSDLYERLHYYSSSISNDISYEDFEYGMLNELKKEEYSEFKTDVHQDIEDTSTNQILPPNEIIDSYLNGKMNEKSLELYKNMNEVIRETFEDYLSLAPNANAQKILAEILLNGQYGKLVFHSELSTNNSLNCETARRLSMAQLYLTNPRTFMALANNGINIFHGTSSINLISILENGLQSGQAQVDSGKKVLTGETYTRHPGKQRNWISFTDVFDISVHYSRDINYEDNFNVIVCTTEDGINNTNSHIYKFKLLSEVGVENNYSVDNINALLVPSDKVDYVQNLVGNRNIQVLPLDNYSNSKPFIVDFIRSYEDIPIDAKSFTDDSDVTIYGNQTGLIKRLQDLINQNYLSNESDYLININNYNQENKEIDSKIIELLENEKFINASVDKQKEMISEICDYDSLPSNTKLIIFTSLLEMSAEKQGLTVEEISNLKGDDVVAPERLEEALTLADSLFHKVSVHEPKITEIMTSFESDNCIVLGTENKLKSIERIAEKMISISNEKNITLEKASSKINDTLRYTLVIEPSDYTEKVLEVLLKFKNEGYAIVKAANTWDNDTYKGVNTFIKAPNGTIFEIQFHTPDSYTVKDIETHMYYEIERNDYASETDKALANEIQKIYTSTISIPDNILGFNFISALYGDATTFDNIMRTPDEIIDMYLKNGMDKYSESYKLSSAFDESDWTSYDKTKIAIIKKYLGLARTIEEQHVLAEILLNGGYEGLCFNSCLCSNTNTQTELARRVSMATLYLTNPETFLTLAKRGVNMFHGTRSSALASILNNGLGSVETIKKNGQEVLTGEYAVISKANETTTRNTKYISFTDVFDIAYQYGNSKDSNNFGIIIGTKSEDIKATDPVAILSTITETGVPNHYPVDKISVLLVPKDKVEYVKELVGDRDIAVLSIDGYDKKAFEYSESLMTSTEKYEELKHYLNNGEDLTEVVSDQKNPKINKPNIFQKITNIFHNWINNIIPSNPNNNQSDVIKSSDQDYYHSYVIKPETDDIEDTKRISDSIFSLGSSSEAKVTLKNALKQGLKETSLYMTEQEEKNTIAILKSLDLNRVDASIVNEYSSENGFDFPGFINHIITYSLLDEPDIEKLKNLDGYIGLKNNTNMTLEYIYRTLDSFKNIDASGFVIIDYGIYNYYSSLIHLFSRDVNNRITYYNQLSKIAELLEKISYNIVNSNKNIYKKINYSNIKITLLGKNTEFLEKAFAQVMGLINYLPPALIKQYLRLDEIKIYDTVDYGNLNSLFKYKNECNNPERKDFISAGSYTRNTNTISLFINAFQSTEVFLFRTIAHELVHALDLYIGKFFGLKDQYFTKGFRIWEEAKIQDNASISQYGESAIFEDFAETGELVAQYFLARECDQADRDLFFKKFPARINTFFALCKLSLISSNSKHITFGDRIDVLQFFESKSIINSDPNIEDALKIILGKDNINNIYSSTVEKKIDFAIYAMQKKIPNTFINLFFNEEFLNNFNTNQVIQLLDVFKGTSYKSQMQIELFAMMSNMDKNKILNELNTVVVNTKEEYEFMYNLYKKISKLPRKKDDFYFFLLTLNTYLTNNEAKVSNKLYQQVLTILLNNSE